MVVAIKFLHLAAIAIWAAGVISLPGFFVQRSGIQSKSELLRLQRVVRFAYVRVLSPAAFLAIASGTGLIFIQQQYSSWFSLKLALVGLLVLIHILTGLKIIRFFEKGKIYPKWRFILATVASILVAAAIIYVVLARPNIGALFSDAIFQAGALKRLISKISPWQIP